MPKPQQTDVRGRTRAFRDRSLSSLLASKDPSRLHCPFLLTGPASDPLTFDWILALPLRKKTTGEREADAKKPLELSPRLQQILLNEGYVYLGRSHENDIVLSPKSVSRIHACIYTNDDKWFVVDLGSSNGTLVNGRLLKENQASCIDGSTTVSFGPDAKFVFMLPKALASLQETLEQSLTSAETSEKIKLPDASTLAKMKADQASPKDKSQTESIGLSSTCDDLDPLGKSGDEEKLALALKTIEATFSLLTQVTVCLTVKDQTVVLYEANDHACLPSSLRESIWGMRGMVKSLNIALSTGGPVEIYQRSP